MEVRQLFRDPATKTGPAATTPLINSQANGCSTYALPIGGVIQMPNGDVVTLTAPAVFRPTCTPVTQPAIIANGGGGTLTIDQTAADDTTIVQLQGTDPFYASTFPQCYALAATTVIAYTLVIMLFVTPRSFLDGGVVVLGRRGFTSGGTGGTNIGGRPWLQKVAALTVAISLTIATSSTFRVAEWQYGQGYQDASYLQSEVLGGTELKVIRIISDTFLWLAQAQTLTRLFPRQREKIIIKWAAFALITLDLIFQCLNSFLYTSQGNTRPRNFTDAVPALSYLFQLSLGVLYAAWVIYYSLMKKRYAFYHQQMKNICLVAMLSIMAILVPVVFFILDICKPEFIGWGDYVRWVGAASASVIVWEWVERIEALEREEKKDGILGREVFDGDEMLDVTPSDFSWPRRRKGKDGNGDGDDAETGGTRSTGGNANGSASGRGNVWPTVSSIATRYRSRSKGKGAAGGGGGAAAAQQSAEESASTQSTNHDRIRFLQPPLWPSRPPPAVTPISRTDTASAASTVYAVRYHPLTETTSRTTPPPPGQNVVVSRSSSPAPSRRSDEDGGTAPAVAAEQVSANLAPARDPSSSRWRALAQGIPFPRISRNTPGSSSWSATEDGPEARYQRHRVQQEETENRWDIRARLEEFAVSRAERIREKMRPSVDTDSLPVTVVPAPPRRGAALAQLLEEQELESLPDLARRSSGGQGSASNPGASFWQGSTATASSAASRPRPAPAPAPGLGPRKPEEDGRTRRLSITIVPAPPRQSVTSVVTGQTQTQGEVLGRQVVGD